MDAVPFVGFVGSIADAAPLPTAMLDEEEQPTPVKSSLEPLGLGQHRGTFKQLGFDDPADFAAQSPADAQEMKSALLQESVPLGHVLRIMRSTAEMKSAAAHPLQHALTEQPSSTSTLQLLTPQRVQPSWVCAFTSPASPSSPALPVLLLSSLDEATHRREKVHADKVARAKATHQTMPRTKPCLPLTPASSALCSMISCASNNAYP